VDEFLVERGVVVVEEGEASGGCHFHEFCSGDTSCSV
jgi:hypothetical protein